MAVETVLLALLGVVAAWLVVDAGRERHRLRARMERAASRTHRSPAGASARSGPRDARVGSVPSADEGWRYWPLTVSTSEDGSIGPRL